jgi:hypothetical protein
MVAIAHEPWVFRRWIVLLPDYHERVDPGTNSREDKREGSS